jgi:hypothetical protein
MTSEGFLKPWGLKIKAPTGEMMKETDATEYQAYMLRLWREGDDLPWRASLQNPHTGEQHSFASLERLFTYLKSQTEHPPLPDKNK